MSAFFDNLDDVNGKFAGTICYYDKVPVVIKQAVNDTDQAGKFKLLVSSLTTKGKYIDLTDPKFNYRDFNLGYTNHMMGAVWWYRRPTRQYRQGLKREQMGWRSSNKQEALDEAFGFNKVFCAMLENRYPNLETVKDTLLMHKIKSAAFHRDFAITYDEIHEDFILEYRGTKIGASLTPNLRQYRIIDDAKYLQESLAEALG